MPYNSAPRRPRRLTETLLVVALLGGGAFFWVNWQRSDAEPSASSRDFSGSREGRALSVRGGQVDVPMPRMQSPHWVKASAAQRKAAIQTIRAQLHAFDIGDWKGAVALQSEGMKSNFSSPDAFGDMITRGYPAFVRARHVDFGEAQVSGPMLQIPITLTGRDDQKVQAEYLLLKEKGGYRVEGVLGGASRSGERPHLKGQRHGIII